MISLLLLITLLCPSLALKSIPSTRTLTPKVTPTPKPIVYVYDHCPFCVRVRLAFGLKNIKHEVRFLANDDVETPTKLIGNVKFTLLYILVVMFLCNINVIDGR